MDIIEDTESRLAVCLADIGLAGVVEPTEPTCLQFEECLLFLTCFDRDGRGWVRISAPVFEEIRPTLRFLHGLLTINHDLLRGGFQLFDDGTVVYSITLDGESLQSASLKHAMRYTARSVLTHREDLLAMSQPLSTPSDEE